MTRALLFAVVFAVAAPAFAATNTGVSPNDPVWNDRERYWSLTVNPAALYLESQGLGRYGVTLERHVGLGRTVGVTPFYANQGGFTGTFGGGAAQQDVSVRYRMWGIDLEHRWYKNGDFEGPYIAPQLVYVMAQRFGTCTSGPCPNTPELRDENSHSFGGGVDGGYKAVFTSGIILGVGAGLVLMTSSAERLEDDDYNDDWLDLDLYGSDYRPLLLQGFNGKGLLPRLLVSAGYSF